MLSINYQTMKLFSDTSTPKNIYLSLGLVFFFQQFFFAFFDQKLGNFWNTFVIFLKKKLLSFLFFKKKNFASVSTKVRKVVR
jgi:hypothetical protein